MQITIMDDRVTGFGPVEPRGERSVRSEPRAK